MICTDDRKRHSMTIGCLRWTPGSHTHSDLNWPESLMPFFTHFFCPPFLANAFWEGWQGKRIHTRQTPAGEKGGHRLRRHVRFSSASLGWGLLHWVQTGQVTWGGHIRAQNHTHVQTHTISNGVAHPLQTLIKCPCQLEKFDILRWLDASSTMNFQDSLHKEKWMTSPM